MPLALPNAEELHTLLLAARDCGVTRLKISPDGVEVEMAPVSPGMRLVEEINSSAPLREDPLAIIRREAAAGNKLPAQDMLEVLASGGRFVQVGSGDPTQPA